jgi:hypothetical protein
MEVKPESSGVVGRGRAALGAESGTGRDFLAEGERLEGAASTESVRKQWAMKTVIIARMMETMMINILGLSVGVGNGSGGWANPSVLIRGYPALHRMLR